MEIKWKGTYSYVEDDSNTISSKFTLIVNEENGKFEGYSVEEEFLKYTDDKPIVKGFIDNDFISFVKSYPHAFEVLESGETKVDKSKKGHEVNYQGYYNENNGCWEGEWEIELLETETSPGNYEILLHHGTWTMN